MARKPIHATMRCESDEDVARIMKIQLDKFEKKAKKNPEWAKKEARRTLIETGVLTKDGKQKENIVMEW